MMSDWPSFGEQHGIRSRQRIKIKDNAFVHMRGIDVVTTDTRLNPVTRDMLSTLRITVKINVICCPR